MLLVDTTEDGKADTLVHIWGTDSWQRGPGGEHTYCAGAGKPSSQEMHAVSGLLAGGGKGKALVPAAQQWEKILLRTGASASQPLPTYAPTVDGLRLSGRVRGPGRVVIVDGLGRRTVREVGTAGTEEEFVILGSELNRDGGSPPLPRFTVELSSRGGAAAFTGVSAELQLPCPDEAALRAEVGCLAATATWVLCTAQRMSSPQHNAAVLGAVLVTDLAAATEGNPMDEEAARFFQELINDSVSALFPQITETIHRWAQYWRS